MGVLEVGYLLLAINLVCMCVDCYLRTKVESLASGHMLMQDVEDEKFISWVAALGSIKVTERPVEGLHSRINTILRANPNTSLAFISNELRFSDLVRIIASDPQATWLELSWLTTVIKCSMWSLRSHETFVQPTVVTVLFEYWLPSFSSIFSTVPGSQAMQNAEGRLYLIEKASGFRREVLRTLNLAMNAEIAALADRDLSNLLFLAFCCLQHFWISFATFKFHVLIDFLQHLLHCPKNNFGRSRTEALCSKVQRFHLDKACFKTGSSETIGRREGIWWFRESCFDQPHHCWQRCSNDGLPHVGSFSVHKTWNS